MPAHDAPKTLYAAWVWSHIHEPAFASNFVRSWPVTGFGFPAVFIVLERFVSWRVAAGLCYSLSIVLFPLASLRLARALAPGREIVGLVGAGMAFHWSVHMGFVGYVISLPLGFLALAIALERDSWSLRREWCVYGLVWAACACHPVGGQIAAVGIAAVRSLRCKRGHIVREIGGTALGLLPVLLVTLIPWVALDALLFTGVRPWDFTLAERITSFHRFFLSGPWWRSVPPVLLAGLGLGWVVFSLVQRPRQPRVVALLVVAMVGMGGWLFAPMNSRSWEYVQPRFLPVLVLMGALFFPVERLSTRWRNVFASGIVGWALATNLWVVGLHRDFFRENHDAYAALGRPSSPGRTLLPILALPELEAAPRDYDIQPVPHALFLLNLGQLYGIDRHAIVPYSFSLLPSMHLILSQSSQDRRVPSRDYAGNFRENTDPKVRYSELVRLASYAPQYDDVLFLGALRDAEELMALGLHPEFREGRLLLGQWRGCSVRVRVEGARTGDGLSVGWRGAFRQVQWVSINKPGISEWLLERQSCQGIWVRFLRKETPEVRCEGAADDGRWESESEEVVCRVAVENQ